MSKIVVWRTWTVKPVLDATNYINQTKAIAPHKNLYFSAKVQGWDYWRWTNFNPILGAGQHQQVVEVSCQRSYEGQSAPFVTFHVVRIIHSPTLTRSCATTHAYHCITTGKGAFPSYIARGAIDGFPEQGVNVPYTNGVRGLRDVIGSSRTSSTVKGLWTWSRGDGNWGPYTKAGELWQTLNCAVMAAYAKDPSRTEEDIFLAVATGSTFALTATDAQHLRAIALAAEDATLKGRYCTAYDSKNVPGHSPSNTWMRDYATGGNQGLLPTMKWLAAHGLTAQARAEKEAAVVLFTDMQTHFDAMAFDAYLGPKRLTRVDSQFPRRLGASLASGRLFFTAVAAAWEAVSFGVEGDHAGTYNTTAIATAAGRYVAAWYAYEAYLLACPTCGTQMFSEFCEETSATPSVGALPGTPTCQPGLASLVQHYANKTAKHHDGTSGWDEDEGRDSRGAVVRITETQNGVSAVRCMDPSISPSSCIDPCPPCLTQPCDCPPGCKAVNTCGCCQAI